MKTSRIGVIVINNKLNRKLMIFCVLKKRTMFFLTLFLCVSFVNVQAGTGIPKEKNDKKNDVQEQCGYFYFSCLAIQSITSQAYSF